VGRGSWKELTALPARWGDSRPLRTTTSKSAPSRGPRCTTPLARGHTLEQRLGTRIGAAHQGSRKTSLLANLSRSFGSLAPPKFRCPGCPPQQARGRAGRRRFALARPSLAICKHRGWMPRRRPCVVGSSSGRLSSPKSYRLRFGRVYFSGRFFGSIFVKPVPFLSSRI
jgi:hypothetical protein